MMHYLWLVVLGVTACGANSPGEAGTTLEIDCRDPANSSDPRCTDDPTMLVGTGPQFLAGNEGGFVDHDQHRVIIAEELLSNTVHGGAVFAVDLATGNRSVVSGTFNDPRDGLVMKGAGPSIGFSSDVQQAPDGSLLVSTTSGGDPATEDVHDELVRIDPATGDRSVVYSDATPTCVFADGTWNVYLGPGTPSPRSLAIGPDGTVYVAMGAIRPPANADDADHGIAAISPTGACRVITMGSPTTLRQLGTGPIAKLDYSGLTLVGTTLYALAGNGRVHAIDLTTGARTLITSPNGEDVTGAGPAALDAYLTLASSSTLWSTGANNGNDPVSAFVAIDLATGNRTGKDWTDGPLGGFEHSQAWAAPHPTLPGVAIMVTDDDVILLELATGNNVRLSH